MGLGFRGLVAFRLKFIYKDSIVEVIGVVYMVRKFSLGYILRRRIQVHVRNLAISVYGVSIQATSSHEQALVARQTKAAYQATQHR